MLYEVITKSPHSAGAPPSAKGDRPADGLRGLPTPVGVVDIVDVPLPPLQRLLQNLLGVDEAVVPGQSAKRLEKMALGVALTLNEGAVEVGLVDRRHEVEFNPPLPQKGGETVEIVVDPRHSYNFV